MSAATERFYKSVKKQFTTEEVLWESEIAGNNLLAKSMIILGIVLGACWFANLEFNFFALDQQVFNDAFYRCTPLLVIPALICFWLKGAKRWLKYFLMIEYILVLAVMSSIMTYTVELAIVFPVIISVRYYNRKFTVQTILVTLILFYVFVNMSHSIGILNLNYVNNAMADINTVHLNGERFADVIGRLVDPETYKHSYIRFHYVPTIILYSLVAIICAEVADKGKEMVIKQKEITNKSARIESELSLATDIQANLLPTIFPPFPERKDVDLFASMTPAKEVGGDFYDFFLVDDDHLALVIGDVSGKGVPAALFMVTAKTLIKDHASMGISSGKVFTRVNELLCEGNDAGLFVTAFMAVINLKTGRVYTVNAGHNPPLVRRAEKVNDGLPGSNCNFEYLQTRPGLVLAGMEGLKYKRTAFNMYPGDTIYLYTDGVTEATNANNELYGEDRLASCLNSRGFDTMEDICTAVKMSVNEFVDVAPQFDDITMLAFKYLGPDGMAENAPSSITVSTTTEHVEYVTEFVEGIMSKYGVPDKVAVQINIAIDEIYSNIAKFAYVNPETGEEQVGSATITVNPIRKADEVKGLALEFKDSGVPYNPLTNEDPLTNLPLEERDIGGLGILIVKKQMDDVQYEYKDGFNVLTITKYF